MGNFGIPPEKAGRLLASIMQSAPGVAHERRLPDLALDLAGCIANMKVSDAIRQQVAFAARSHFRIFGILAMQFFQCERLLSPAMLLKRHHALLFFRRSGPLCRQTMYCASAMPETSGMLSLPRVCACKLSMET